MSRGDRVHHAQRIKQKRAKYRTVSVDPTPRRVGKAVHTACACSCDMCGNPRRHHGLKTIQEMRKEVGGE